MSVLGSDLRDGRVGLVWATEGFFCVVTSWLFCLDGWRLRDWDVD